MELNTLVSYNLHLTKILTNKFINMVNRLPYSVMMIDSGAFSAHMAGFEIDIYKYIDFCHTIKLRDISIFMSLDVIGDPEASLRNAEIMTKNGVNIVPTFHFGEPLHYLDDMKRLYPLVAAGGVARKGVRIREEFVDAVFSRIWPHRIHGLGITNRNLLMKYPFQSTDSSSWELGVRRAGRWPELGRVGQRGSRQNMVQPVMSYIKLQHDVRGVNPVKMLGGGPYCLYMGVTATAALRTLFDKRHELKMAMRDMEV